MAGSTPAPWAASLWPELGDELCCSCFLNSAACVTYCRRGAGGWQYPGLHHCGQSWATNSAALLFWTLQPVHGCSGHNNVPQDKGTRKYNRPGSIIIVKRAALFLLQPPSYILKYFIV